MKRFLLSLSVAFVATATFAQGRISSFDKGEMAPMPQKIEVATQANVANTTAIGMQNSPRRSKATGLYYYKPYGSMYDNTMNSVGGVYMATFLVIPAWDDCTYINMSNNPTANSWYCGTYDMEDFVEPNGDLTIGLYPGYGYYEDGGNPFMVLGSEAFGMGAKWSDGYGPYVYAANEMEMLGFLDNKETATLGSLSSGYMIGTGTYTGNLTGLDAKGDTVSISGTFTCSHVTQHYPAPASPVYVQNIYLEGVFLDMAMTDNEPLKNGATLTMEICDSETGELLETLTATTGCFTSWGYLYDSSYNYYNAGLIKFSKWEDDDLFGSTEAPIVIDRATTVYVRGFENSDVNFGVRLDFLKEWDGERELSEARAGFVIPNDEITPFGLYYSSSATGEVCSLNLHMEGLMDKVYVGDTLVFGDGAQYGGYNVLKISDDGKECYTYGMDENSSYNLRMIYTETACEWFDENSNENYYFSNLPDWITSVYVNDYYYDVNSLSYVNYVWFDAEPLPSDVSGRMAAFRLHGRGIASDVYVVVVQGDADPTGIENIQAATTTNVSSKGTYNVAGQRVSDSAKGLLIRDGKKFIAR